MAQISIEDAFPTFRKRLGELFEENLLLRAQVDVLERQLAAAQQQNTPPAEGHADASVPAGPDPST